MTFVRAQLEAVEEDRREHPRQAESLPLLQTEFGYIRLIDFSDTGFRAIPGASALKQGASGRATLHLNACGYAVRKEIAYEVLRVDGDMVAARYETLRTVTEHTGCGI
jgi:hypothetical protein